MHIFRSHLITRALTWSVATALLCTAQTSFAYLSPDDVFGPPDGSASETIQEETEAQDEADASSFEQTVIPPESVVADEEEHSSASGKVFYRNGETVEVKPVQRETEESSSSSTESLRAAGEEETFDNEEMDTHLKAMPLEETTQQTEAPSLTSALVMGALLLVLLMVFAGVAFFVIKRLRGGNRPGQDLPVPPPVVLPSSRLHQSLHPTEPDSSAS